MNGNFGPISTLEEIYGTGQVSMKIFKMLNQKIKVKDLHR